MKNRTKKEIEELKKILGEKWQSEIYAYEDWSAKELNK